jgi:hypothetical protein
VSLVFEIQYVVVSWRAEYNQPDGMRPGTAGEKIMTEKAWRGVEPLLEQARK